MTDNVNLWRELLKELPKGKVSVIANDPENSEIARQLTAVIESKNIGERFYESMDKNKA